MRLLATIGITAFVIGAVGLVILNVVRPEKAAVYLLGHWFDVTWEILVPLIIIGVALTAITLGVQIRHRRPLR